MRYFQGEARGNCLIRLTQYPPKPVSKQFCKHTFSLGVAAIIVCKLEECSLLGRLSPL